MGPGRKKNWYKHVIHTTFCTMSKQIFYVPDPEVLWLLPASVKLWQANTLTCKELKSLFSSSNVSVLIIWFRWLCWSLIVLCPCSSEIPTKVFRGDGVSCGKVTTKKQTRILYCTSDLSICLRLFPFFFFKIDQSVQVILAWSIQ